MVAQNRRARHDYAILDTFEAGLVLTGTEVKSLRAGKASLSEAYATVQNDEAFVVQLHIPPYEQGNRWNTDPVRSRKLLPPSGVERSPSVAAVSRSSTCTTTAPCRRWETSSEAPRSPRKLPPPRNR